MSNIYEETMPLESNSDEYLLYLYDEEIPLFQRLTTIIKKGESFQRQALLSKLNLIQTSENFKSLMEYILNDIQIWDKETITLFPRYLYPLFTTSRDILLKSIDNELFNSIFKKFITIISSTEEQISKEYMIYLEKIIEHFNKEKKENSLNFPYKINEEIYDTIITLSKFDESELNKQLSCCLCCSVIRLINDIKEEHVQKLYARICYLFTYWEKQIEIQLARELEFLLEFFGQKILDNSDVMRAVSSYIERDSDSALQTTTIISLLKNLHLINDGDIVKKIINKIKEIFIDEFNFEQENKNKIFFELIKILEKNYKKIDINIINKLFEDEFISDFIENNSKEEVIIENFDVIFFVYENALNEIGTINSDEIGENDKEKNFNWKLNFNELFIKIYNHYFNCYNSDNFLTQRKGNFTENEISDKKILYNNLMKILPFLSGFKKNRCLFDKFNHLFNSDNIIFALNYYAENFTNISSEGNNSKNNNILYNLMHFFLKKNFDGQNLSLKPTNLKSLSPPKKDVNSLNHEGYYLKLFNNILTNILEAFNESPKLFNNNIHLLLCDFFQKIIKKLYKYLIPTMRELDKLLQSNLFLDYMNRIKIKSLDKIYDEIFFNYLVKIINNQKLGNHIRNESIKVVPYLILYGKNRVNYFRYIQEHIIQSKNFFNRRYSVVYLEKCLQIFSFKMFNKIGLLDFLITLTEDENNSISANIINLIYVYNNKITKNSGIMFQNILKNLSKINKDNKDNKIIHIENFDIEKNRIINNILSIDYNDDKNKNNEHWTNLENELIGKEKEIFGDDSFYGFRHLKNVVRSQTLNLNSQSYNIKPVKRKSSCLINQINKDKEKINSNNKKALARDKCASSVSINNYHYSKTILPKIKPNRNNAANSINGKIILKPPLKKLNNFKIKQENQKFHENITKNNNSMVINDKVNIKSSYDFIQKNKLETKAIKISHLPFYQDLSNSLSLKQESILIESNKFANERKHKDPLLHTMYKTKSLSGYHFDLNPKINKTIKLKKNSLKEKSASYNKINFKTNVDFDKLSNNISLNKEKNGLLKWYINNIK